MGRNNRASRHSNYVIRIVCEGNKTEPLFFTSLCDLYYKDKVGMDVRTVPQPYVPQDEDAKNSDRGSYKGKKRQVKREKEFIPEEVKITGVPPLKWVQYARNLLAEGVDETWAVYDKDNHPMHKEAMEEADKIIDGKKVYVAFSSRSFEYYLLLHFEYIYHRFNETECGEKINGKKKIFECGTGKNPEKDCGGKNCINGYARDKGYWKETKTSESTFPLVKDNLWKGMINARRLRAESDASTEKPIYERNPYTNVDLLVGRLLGKETVDYGSLYQYKEHGHDWSVKLCEDGLIIKNNKAGTELFPKDFFRVYDFERKIKMGLNDKVILLKPDEELLVPCKLEPQQTILIKIDPDKEVLMLSKFPE